LEIEVAKKAAKRKITRKEYEASDIKLLKMHSNITVAFVARL
jgi:hypothetical protein